MKNTYIIIGIIVVVAALAFIFGRKGEETPVVAEIPGNTVGSTNLTDGTYMLNPDASSIKWMGEYTTGVKEEGTISLASGSIMVANTEPSSGNFEIDVNSVKADSNMVLENYLKGKDFLDADQFPTASFVISNIISSPGSATTTGKYIVDGKLTIQGKTNSVSFPAVFSQNGKTLTADSSFAINRTEWELTNNKEIKNAVLIELHIEATK